MRPCAATRSNNDSTRTVTARRVGSGGARTSRRASGERCARTTARAAPRGTTSPTTTRGHAPIAGAKTASAASATDGSTCASRSRCGTATTRSSRSDCSDSRTRRATTARTSRSTGGHSTPRRRIRGCAGSTSTRSAPFRTTTSFAENRRRGVGEPEYELVDTGIFDDDRYFDIELTYAKAAPEDICIVIDCTNRGPDAATLHVLPTLWFRNTWSWGRDDRHPWLQLDGEHVEASHATVRAALARGRSARRRTPGCSATTRRTTNASTARRTERPIRRTASTTTSSTAPRRVNPAMSGTKVAAWYRLDDRLRRDRVTCGSGSPISRRRSVRHDLRRDARGATGRGRRVLRAARAGRVGGGSRRATPCARRAAVGEEALPLRHPRSGSRAIRRCRRRLPAASHGRNAHWPHLYNADIISMPDEWEYPWYAAWDLAFHMIPLALVDPDFAKEQLLLFCREWYMHPNGQLPAYEWALRRREPAGARVGGMARLQDRRDPNAASRDWDFLERIFHKLLMNFSWWVNRKDAEGNNLFEGGFLGLDNIGLFDRSRPLAERRRTRAVRRHVVDGDVLPQHARDRGRARASRSDLRGRVHEVLRALPDDRFRRAPSAPATRCGTRTTASSMTCSSIRTAAASH